MTAPSGNALRSGVWPPAIASALIHSGPAIREPSFDQQRSELPPTPDYRRTKGYDERASSQNCVIALTSADAILE